MFRSIPALGRFFLLPLGLLFAGMTLAPPALLAQDRSLVDRIAAVVGDSVIVLSQLEERIFSLQSQGTEIPERGSDAWIRLQRDLLDQMIGELLIVQAALQDTTIVVNDLEVENLVSQEIDRFTTSYGGQAAIERGLAQQGLTLSSYREFLRGQIRQQRLYQQFMGKRSGRLSSVIVEEAEIQEFFEAQKEAIGARPPTVVWAQIILAPTASDSGWAAAEAEAQEIRQLLADGGDFAELARRFSDDGSKDSGGDLGWFRRGVMVEAFEEAAFALAVNEISPPVRSPFGYHIIQLNRRRSGEVRASHILVKVDPGPADLNRTRETALDVKARLEAGEDFVALWEEFGLPNEPDTLSVPFDRLQELPPGFAEPLAQSEPGQVLGPLEYEVRGETRMAVMKIVEVLPAGEYTADDEDLRARIMAAIQQEKLVDQILAELRSKTYIQIRM